MSHFLNFEGYREEMKGRDGAAGRTKKFVSISRPFYSSQEKG